MNATAEQVIADVMSSLEAGKLAIFVGAGISYHSGLPLAADLEEAILEAMKADPEDVARIISSGLPFEAFMGEILGNCTIRQLLRVFGLGQPNRNHTLLAKLAARGYLRTICTTNFDTLIETAFENNGLHPGNGYRLFHTDGDFRGLESAHRDCSIIKLHGTIKDEGGIAITLESVAGQIHSASRRAAIRHVFASGNHEHILILGYSCSDVFDINPQIEQFAVGGKKLTLVQHCGSPDATDNRATRTEDLRTQTGKNPFRQFSHATRLLLDTDSLIYSIWKRFFPKELPQQGARSESLNWASMVDTWASTELCEHSHAVGSLLTGTILFKSSLFKEALRYYERAMNTAREEHNQVIEAVLLNRIGNAHRCIGHMQDAIDSYEAALALADSLDTIYGKAIEYHDLGVAYKDLGLYPKAIGLLERALGIARRIEDTREIVGVLGDLGNVCNRVGEYKRAIGCLSEAVQLARLHGYKQAEGDILSGLGTACMHSEDFPSAIRYHEAAMEISGEIGDQRGRGISASNLGTAYTYLGEPRRAIELYTIAVDIARATNGKRQEGEALGNIGFQYIHIGEYQNAISYLERALRIFGELGDQLAMANALANLGAAYWGLGRDEEGDAFIRRALAEFRRLLGNEHPRVRRLDLALEQRRRKEGGQTGGLSNSG
jgi:tetratricopeptide (TPR) repeat protein